MSRIPWDKVRAILKDENDKALWRQLIVTLVDKGLLGLIVVVIAFVGNWALEEHKIRQTQAQTQTQFLFGKRLDAIQQIADAYGQVTGGFLGSTVEKGPGPEQVKTFDQALEKLYTLTNQYEVVLPETFADELERHLWVYKGMTHEPPAQWPGYRGFVTDLASGFEAAWRRSLPTVPGEAVTRRPGPSFATLERSVQQVTREGTKAYFEDNLAAWRARSARR
jgi:hypothetical protein